MGPVAIAGLRRRAGGPWRRRARWTKILVMASVNVHEAKTHLSRLLQRVEQGEEIVIARDGEPVARLVPIAGRAGKRTLGDLEGADFWIAPDFDAPMTDAWDGALDAALDPPSSGRRGRPRASTRSKGPRRRKPT